MIASFEARTAKVKNIESARLVAHYDQLNVS
jgi:hypothetical protein